MASEPQHEPLGYEAALDLGTTALESGFSAAALPYFERAAALRPTRFVLVQLAKTQRDQGRSKDARETLLRARERPDGEDAYVLVSLAASLCDLGEHGAALEVARDAVRLNPEDSAALSVYSRTMNEALGALAKHDHIDPEAIRLGRIEASKVAARASNARPADAPDLRERRRRRAQAHWSPPALRERISAPLEQDLGLTLAESPHVVDAVPAPIEVPDAGGPPLEELAPRLPWWQRALQALRLRVR
jgi:tetratricopeptide (TPR) repeat protein